MSDEHQPTLSKPPSQADGRPSGPGLRIDPGVPGGPHVSFPRAEDGPSSAAAQTDRSTRRATHAGPRYELTALGLKKSYQKGGTVIPVLRGLNLGVRRGEFLAVVGQSGSGKSTLLHLLGTLDAPDDGAIYFQGRRIDNLPNELRDQVRNKHFGMIFQMYHLLPELTALENVLTPLMIREGIWGFLRRRREHRAAAARVLEMVGLGHRLKHKPRELSGGEMQRAAIARALVARPQLLLADEPTGNLDGATGREILEILASLNRQQNVTIVMVTHDQGIAQRADRVVRLADGRIEEL